MLNRFQLSNYRLRYVVGLGAIIFVLGATACSAAPAESSFDQSNARFAPCPDSPNCVSTQADASDETHFIEPLTYAGSVAEAKEQLLTIVNAMPRTTEVTASDDYLHFEFRSRIFRFVDDVEFYLDDATKTIHFRSAARMGYSDMDVNRNRMEEIRTQFNQGG